MGPDVAAAELRITRGCSGKLEPQATELSAAETERRADRQSPRGNRKRHLMGAVPSGRGVEGEVV